MIRILLADDHPVFRRGLELVLSGIADFQVCAIAENGEQAVELAAMHRPEVVIMDLRMPLVDGIGATGRIVSRNPAPAVLVLSMFGDGELVLAALRAGARGYLLKGAGQDEVVRAIGTVHAGGVVFGASLAARVTRAFAAPANPRAAAFPQLTDREREVLDLIAAGRTNAQIAAELFLSGKTVRNNVSTILSKLQAGDRANVIIRARDAGFGHSS